MLNMQTWWGTWENAVPQTLESRASSVVWLAYQRPDFIWDVGNLT